MLERSGGRLFSERSIVAAALGGSSVRSAEMCLPPVAEAVPGMPPVAEAVPGAAHAYRFPYPSTSEGGLGPSAKRGHRLGVGGWVSNIARRATAVIHTHSPDGL